MDPVPGPPPDIQTALLALVKDPHSSSSQAMHVPLLVQRRCAAVQRSIDVLRVFRTLHHALEETSSLVITPACVIFSPYERISDALCCRALHSPQTSTEHDLNAILQLRTEV